MSEASLTGSAMIICSSHYTLMPALRFVSVPFLNPQTQYDIHNELVDAWLFGSTPAKFLKIGLQSCPALNVVR